MKTYYKHTDIGVIGISENLGAITNLYFENDIRPVTLCEETELIKEAFSQLFAYLSGKLKVFSIPLMPQGSSFMKSVWKSIEEIQYGETKSYKAIATKIGNQSASRAIGMASKRTPTPIFIPCHRIIGSNGSLTGYRGGLDIKRRLLSMEKNHTL